MSFGNSYSQVRRLFVGSAILVVLVRILGPFPIGWDQSVQLEAAHRVVSGNGLTTTYSATPERNINTKPTPKVLTHYPPTFSLIVAAGLWFGIPLVVFLKCLYSVVTLVGWTAWGTVGQHVMTRSSRIGGRAVPLQYAIACILPLFVTPRWSGTDIFLWLGVPLIVILVQRRKSSQVVDTWSVASAGLVSGLAVSIRYTSLFTLVLGAFLLFQAYGGIARRLLRSYAVFGAASLAVIALVGLLNQTVDGYLGLPEFIGDSYGRTTFSESVDRLSSSLSAMSVLFGYRPSQIVVGAARAVPTVNHLYGWLWLIVVASLPLVLYRRGRSEGQDPRRDFTLALSLVQCSLVLFLIAATSSPATEGVGGFRFYVPAGPAGILIVYRLLHHRGQLSVGGSRVLAGALCLFLVISVGLAGLTIYPLISRGSVEVLGRDVRARDLVQPVLGFSPGSYPDGYVTYPSSEAMAPFQDSVRELRELKAKHPEAVMYVGTGYPYFAYDGYKGFRRVPDKDFWEGAFAAADVTTYWLVHESCPTVCIQDDVERPVIDEARWQTCFQPVSSFPHERTKIVKCTVRGSHRFSG